MAKTTSKEKIKTDRKLSKVLADLKAEYLEALPTKIEKIKKLTEEEKWPEIYEEYHKLKGTGKTYGFPEISILCERMEKLAQKKESQIVPLFLEAALLLAELHQAFLKINPMISFHTLWVKPFLSQDGKNEFFRTESPCE